MTESSSKVREITIYSTWRVGDGLGTPDAHPLGTFEINKMAAIDLKCSISTILRKNWAL